MIKKSTGLLQTSVKSGFTLIELLVVIAIIGILSSVVLAALNSARSKGSDAAVKSAMTNFTEQATLYYDTGGNSSYNLAAGTVGPSCTGQPVGSVLGDSQAKNILNNIVSNATSHAVSCWASSSAFVIIATLTSGSWCVDSNGYVSTSSARASDGLCL